MISKALLLGSLVLASASSIDSLLPASGEYKDQDGAEYDVVSIDSRILKVNGEGSFCLEFERGAAPDVQRGLERLEGHGCEEDTGTWVAIYPLTRPNHFILYPPGTFENPDLRPIELRIST